MDNFDVSRIFIKEGNSYDIMYGESFVKLRMKRKRLPPYEGSNLQAFNDMITRMCRSIYIYIFDIPFMKTLDIMSYPVHLKIKYHNVKVNQ